MTEHRNVEVDALAYQVHITTSRQQPSEWLVLGEVECCRPWQPVEVEIRSSTLVVTPAVSSSPQTVKNSKAI